ncbi:MAG: CocE/NonD family hydrolase, partial [Nitriliruptorales bacterium]
MSRPAVYAVAALVGAVLAAPAAAQEGTGAPSASGRTEPVYEETVTEEYRVETEHGTMYGVVERPDPEAYPELYSEGQGTRGAGVPVLLVLSPYNNLYQPVAGGPQILSRGFGEFFVPRGYAYARFDVVGTRESTGCFDYGGVRERETGAAVVDFLGTRDWSNGRVGMIGGSYDGTTQLATAVEAPEHLVAILPQVAIDRWYDYAFGGGIRYLLNSEDPTEEGFDTPFAFDFGFALIPPSDLDPASGEVLATRIEPCDRLLHTERAYDPDPVYDDFWLERDYRRLAHRVRAAVFLEGGWQDDNVKHWDTTRFFAALPRDHPKRMAIGQWGHASSQFEDAEDLRHAWFDHWLLGFDTGIMELPPVDTEPFNGERRQERSWPPPGTVDVRLDLAAGGEEAARGELLLRNADEPAWTDSQPQLTEEQVFDLGCGDACLLFTGAPLDRDVRISGGPVLHLRATSDDASTHLVPVLFHENPDGGITVVERGFLNTRNRAGLDVSEPLTPGEPYEAPVPIWDTDHIVPAGHRIGVAIMSANAAWALHDDDTFGVTTTLE